MQSFDDLLPQLLVDDVNQSAASHHQIVEFVEVEHLFGHDRQSGDRRACNQKNKKKIRI